MTKEQKLLGLLQPKEYKSKIKLYCFDCNFSFKKVANVVDKSYIYKIIEIKDKNDKNKN